MTVPDASVLKPDRAALAVRSRRAPQPLVVGHQPPLYTRPASAPARPRGLRTVLSAQRRAIPIGRCDREVDFLVVRGETPRNALHRSR